MFHFYIAVGMRARVIYRLNRNNEKLQFSFRAEYSYCIIMPEILTYYLLVR